jgi:hypothetical protein
MNQRIAGVVAGVAMIAGLAGVSTVAAGVAAADSGPLTGRSTQQGDGRDLSITDTPSTVDYGGPTGDSREFGREFSSRDQAARDQACLTG